MCTLRILIVHTTNPRHTFGDRIRVENVQKSLSKAGFHVFDTRIPLSYNRYTFIRPRASKDILDNLFPLHHINHLKPSFSYINTFDSILFSTSLNFLRKIVQRVMPDVILAEASRVGWVSTIVAKEFSIPCIVDMHGLAFAEAKGRKQKNWYQILGIEIEAFENCDNLIVVSKRMKDYVTKKMNISRNKIVIAPNGSDTQQNIAHYDTPLKVIYAGGFSYWESVHDFLNIAKYADPKIFRFYIAGNNSTGKTLFKRIKKENIRVTYLGYAPRQRIFTVLSKMHIGIAPSTRDLTRQVASPVKVFDYLAAGLPVVTPKIGDWGDIVEQENCGIALNEDTTENYVKALNTLIAENVWTTKSKNAIKSIQKKYTWNKALEPITNLLLTYKK
ncbi:MAG: glycosyltransferase [Candidatus Bathyarchaeota archaeon]|nr:MAG: glycosyltransferase [Candidatus Bathyarchaeota archaeon]